jgi:predicted O-methyltransferase YrrM
MYSRTGLAFRYLDHFFRASNGKGHGIHSPFVFDFVTGVLNDRRYFYAYEAIEKRRVELENDRRMIETVDYGKTPPLTRKVSVSDIARRALSTRKFGQLLFRLVDHYQPAHIIELGSSLGISGAYLASANPACSLTTLEGSPAIAAIAAETFRPLQLPSIRQIIGPFDEKLGEAIASGPPAGLVYIDGNHRKAPLLAYFRQFMHQRAPEAVFVLHDIHWSLDMEAAWTVIKDHPEVMLTIDLFSAGLVFFRDAFRVKQHFIIRF